MQGKVVVITGGTSGIGQVSAEKLAAMGARIVLVARSKSRGEAALSRLREIAPKENHRVHYGDVSRLNDLHRFATEIKTAEPRIDVLINNAGAVFGERQVTEDGLELTFATNHMSYFVADARFARRAFGGWGRASDQYFFGRSLSCQDRFRRSADEEQLQYYACVRLL